MAVSPNELMTNLSKVDEALVGILEDQIDDALRTKWEGASRTTISISKYPNPRVEAELVKRYLAVGWGKMEFIDEQRDGPFVALDLLVTSAALSGPPHRIVPRLGAPDRLV